jgi:hypothetical protein
VSKIKELIVDYRKRTAEKVPVNTDGAEVKRVESFKFLGVHITNKLPWPKHTKTIVKRAQQHLLPLRRLKRFAMGPQIRKRFLSCTIDGCITATYGNCSASALQRVARMAQCITGPSFLTSRTYILGSVRGRPKQLSKTQSPKS